MNSRRPDRRDEDDRYRRDYDEDRDRRDRRDRDYDDDDRDRRRYDEEDDRRGRRRRYEDEEDDRERRPRRRYEDEDDRDRPRRSRRKRGPRNRTAVWVVVTLVGMLLLGAGGFLLYYFVFSGGSARSRLVGQWAGSINGLSAVLSFNDDSTWTLSGNGVTLGGKWSVRRSFGGIAVRIENGSRLSPAGKAMRPTEDWDIHFHSDDEITISDQSTGITMSTFKRVKPNLSLPRLRR